MTTKETDSKLWVLVIGLLVFVFVAKLVLGWWAFIAAVVLGTILVLWTISQIEVDYDPSKSAKFHDEYEGFAEDEDEDPNGTPIPQQPKQEG